MSENYRPGEPRPQAGPSRFDAPRRPAAGQGARPQQRQTPVGRPVPPRRPAPAPAAASGAKGLLPKGFGQVAVVCALVLVAGILLNHFMPGGYSTASGLEKLKDRVNTVTEIHSTGPLRINEVMSANGGVLVDESGATPDWIEIANISGHSVSLKDYKLARTEKASKSFVFPDMTLGAGECVLVMADSQLKMDAGGELHAPFKLSSSGDVLMLFNTANTAVDTVNIPALPENTAYVRTGDAAWEIGERPTPGMLNTEENYRAMHSVAASSPVMIVELVASSSQYGPDENGVCYDYILLRNTASEAVDLSGWYLSDDVQMPRDWRFPSGVSIPGNGTLLVHASGLDRTANPAHLHTGFRLSSEGDSVVLSNASGQLVDSVSYDLLKTDTAYLRGADGSWSVGTPTAQRVEPAT